MHDVYRKHKTSPKDNLAHCFSVFTAGENKMFSSNFCEIVTIKTSISLKREESDVFLLNKTWRHENLNKYTLYRILQQNQLNQSVALMQWANQGQYYKSTSDVLYWSKCSPTLQNEYFWKELQVTSRCTNPVLWLAWHTKKAMVSSTCKVLLMRLTWFVLGEVATNCPTCEVSSWHWRWE